MEFLIGEVEFLPGFFESGLLVPFEGGSGGGDDRHDPAMSQLHKVLDAEKGAFLIVIDQIIKIFQKMRSGIFRISDQDQREWHSGV